MSFFLSEAEEQGLNTDYSFDSDSANAHDDDELDVIEEEEFSIQSQNYNQPYNGN